MSDRSLAVVCVSGGMDSALTAALAAREHRLAFLHASYGQRTETKELACFHALADHYDARRAASSWTSPTCARSAAAA